MRWIRILGWVLGALVAVVGGLAAAVWLGGAPVLAWAIEHPGSAMIGREVRIAGRLTVHWGSPTRIVAEDVHVANANWGSDPEMFAARRIEIDLFLRTLLRGPARIPLIEIDGAKLLLEKSKSGEGNWTFGLNSAAPKKRHEFPDLERFLVRQSDLVWRDGGTGAQTGLAISDLSYGAPDPASAVSIVAAGSFTGSFQTLPIRISATVGPLAELRNPTTPYPVKLDGSVGQSELAADGTVQEPLDFAGVDLRLSMSGRKLDEIASALGVPMPELPDFRGTSQLAGGNGNWALNALTIALGKSDLQGGLKIDTNQTVPHIRADLTSSHIDLADFKGVLGAKPAHASTPASPQQKATAATGRILPDTPIAVHKLPGTNIDLSFDGTRITSTSGLPFERVSLGLQVKDGELTVKPLRFYTAQGDVDLNLHFTPFTQDSPPRLGAELDVRHVDLHQLLRTSSTDMVRQTGGIVGGFAKLDTSGRSLRELLGRMTGDAGIFMQDGQLSALVQRLAPIDVVGALGVYVSGDQPLPINCLVSRFDIRDGIATASTLAGAGNVNFTDETLFLTLTPYNKNATAVSLRTPVDIGGTFAAPAFHLHTGGIIAKLGAAVGLGVLFPPAALLPLVDAGLGERNACSTAYAAQQPTGNPTPSAGTSAPPSR
jgi:AsmA family protein